MVYEQHLFLWKDSEYHDSNTRRSRHDCKKQMFDVLIVRNIVILQLESSKILSFKLDAKSFYILTFFIELKESAVERWS